MANHRFYVDSKALGPSKLVIGTSPSAGSAPAAHGLEWDYNGHPFIRNYADWSYYKYAPGNGIDKFGKLRAYNYSVYGENCSIELRNDHYANMNRPLNGSFSDAGNQSTPEISTFSLSYRNQGWNSANANANDYPSLDDLLDKVVTAISQGDPWWNKYLRDDIQPTDSSFIVGHVGAIFETDGPSYAHQTKMNYYDGTTSGNTKVVITPTYNFYINYEAAIAEIPIGYEILLPNFYMFETEVRNPGNAYQWLLTLGDTPLFGDPATTGQSNNDWFAALTGVTPGQTAHGQYFGGYAYALGQHINNSTLSDVYDSFRTQSSGIAGPAETLVVLWSDLHILQDYTIRDPQSIATTDDDIMASIFYPFYNKIEIKHTDDWHSGGRSNVGGGGGDSPFAQMAAGAGGIGGQLIDYIQGYVVEKWRQGNSSIQSWNEDPYLKNGTPDRAVEFDSNDPNAPTAAVYQSKQEYTVHLDLENMILELMEDLTGNNYLDVGGAAFSPMFQSSAGPTTTGPLLKSLDGAVGHPNTSLVNTPGALFPCTLLRAYDDVDASVNYLQHPHDAAALYGQAQNNIASTLSTKIASSRHLTDGYIQRLRDMFKPNASKIRTCISETLFYVIEKHRLGPGLEIPAVGAQPDQRFFISRDFTNNRKLTYYDTQVLYGERYYYEVKQLRVIWGNKYNYEVAATTTAPSPGKGRALANALGYFKDEDPNLWLNSGMASQAYWEDTYGDDLWLPDCADQEATPDGSGDGDCATAASTENTDSNWSSTGQNVIKKLDGYYIFEPTNSDWLLFYPGGFTDTNNDGVLNQAPWCTDIFNSTGGRILWSGESADSLGNPVGDYPCDDTGIKTEAKGEGAGDAGGEVDWSDANLQNFILQPEFGYGLDGNPTGGMMGVEMLPAEAAGDSPCPPGWYDCGEVVSIEDVPWPENCSDCPDEPQTVTTVKVVCCEECDDPISAGLPKGCPNRLPYKDQCPPMFNTISCQGGMGGGDIPQGWVCCDCDVGIVASAGDCPPSTDPDASVFEGPDCPSGWHQVGSFWNSDCIECKRDINVDALQGCRDSTPQNAANQIMGPGVNCPMGWQWVQSHTAWDGTCKECAPPAPTQLGQTRPDCPTNVTLQSLTNQLFQPPLGATVNTPCCPADWTLVTMHGPCCECTRTGRGGGPGGSDPGFDI